MTPHTLSNSQQKELDQAKENLQASENETDQANYARHLGVLEIALKNMIDLVGTLTTPGVAAGDVAREALAAAP